MGDQADEHREMFEETLHAHRMGECDCEHQDEYRFGCIFEMQRGVRDMNLERDKTFGDDLMAHLERRKKKGRAAKFLRRWRSN